MNELSFDTAKDYLGALYADPTMAVISMQMAADARDVSRAAIDRMVRIGQLEGVRIDGTRYVRASSMRALKEKREQQVAQVRKFLEKCARKSQNVVFYEPVMDIVGLKTTIPADRKRIGVLLGEVSEQTYEESKILLTAIVHRKTASRTTHPGPGFFNLAKSVGLKWDRRDDAGFLDREIEKVRKHYASRYVS